jgi:hypothetical protein
MEAGMTDNTSSSVTTPHYKAAIWKEGDRFFIEQPDLEIRVHAVSLQEAYEKLDASVEATLKEYLDSGSAPPAPSEDITGGLVQTTGSTAFAGRLLDFGGEIRLFLAKTAIVGVFIGAIMIFGLNYAVVRAVDSAVNRTVGLIHKVMSGSVATQGYIAMHRLADRLRQATPEERDDLHRDLRTIARELKPFLVELQGPPGPTR